MAERVVAIDKDARVLLNEALSPERRSAMIAAFARSQRDEVAARNNEIAGRVLPFSTTVDGVAGASEDRVGPNGRIAYEWSLTGGVVDAIYEMIVQASPFRSGRYAHSHMIFADGVRVESPDIDAREWVIVSAVPYARKIERGESIFAPHGVYQAVAAVAKARFGNAAVVKFTYRAVQDAALVEGSGGMRPGTRRSRAAGRDARQPAIEITFR